MMSIEQDDDYTGESSTESGSSGQGSRPISQIGSRMGRKEIRGNSRSHRLSEDLGRDSHHSVRDVINRS
jgi:hypothetical protein